MYLELHHVFFFFFVTSFHNSGELESSKLKLGAFEVCPAVLWGTVCFPAYRKKIKPSAMCSLYQIQSHRDIMLRIFNIEDGRSIFFFFSPKNTQQHSFWFTKSVWFHFILHVQKLNPDMCCIRVYHDNALLRPIQICTVWTLYIYLYSFYFFLYGFLKTQPGAVSTACAPFVATSKTAVIANCPDFKQMHNIRTTIKLGAIEPVS